MSSLNKFGKICLSKFCIPFGVRQKMVLILVTVLVSASTVAGYFFLKGQEKAITEHTRQRGQDISKYLSEAIALHVVGYDYHSIQIMLDELIDSKDIQQATVFSAKGNIMAKAGDIMDNLGELTLFYHDIVFNNEKVGELHIALNNSDIVARLEKEKQSLFTRELLTILIIAIGEFLALSYFIARPVTKIAQSLENNIDEKGRINRDINIASNDEFGQLAMQFNKMRRQLNEAHSELENKIVLADKELFSANTQLKKKSNELIRMNRDLELLAITDPLTGIYNRRHFEATLKEDIKRSVRTKEINSLIIVDIDNFKTINDAHGHQNGDIVLRELTALLLNEVRKSDVICRIGGEEFAIICRNTESDGAKHFADKLRSHIETRSITIESGIIRVTVSMGVATVDPELEHPSMDKYFRMADTALYHSKKGGRNQVTHYKDISLQSRKVI